MLKASLGRMCSPHRCECLNVSRKVRCRRRVPECWPAASPWGTGERQPNKHIAHNLMLAKLQASWAGSAERPSTITVATSGKLQRCRMQADLEGYPRQTLDAAGLGRPAESKNVRLRASKELSHLPPLHFTARAQEYLRRPPIGHLRCTSATSCCKACW